MRTPTGVATSAGTLFPLWIPRLVCKLKFTTNIPNYFYWFLICLSFMTLGPTKPRFLWIPTAVLLGGTGAAAWGWPLPCRLRLRMSGTIRPLSTVHCPYTGKIRLVFLVCLHVTWRQTRPRTWPVLGCPPYVNYTWGCMERPKHSVLRSL